ncbi:MAG: TAXI family TRAP transporter solute-binding subunit [Sulfolobales archaeon]|nr:TAXI family TRAP transporter solute-binding subunit [Sulfolobales archaeon]MDW8082448.1 TAXI family TRAP transporter solute-binding subunit [Sulfolobales archaeon]
MKTPVLIGLIIVALVVAGIAVYTLWPRPVAKPFTLNIWTGGTGGVYYPLGVKLSEMLNKYAGDVISSSVSTSGASVANMRALSAGDAHLVFVQNDIAYYAFRGIYMFEGSKVEVARGVAVLYPEIVQIVVRADSGIKSIYDLEGKRVAIGAAGSGTAVEAELILRAAGLWGKIAIQNLDFSAAAESIKLGLVDAAFVVAGIPTSAVLSLAATVPVNLVEVPDDILNKLTEQGYRFFIRYTVPANTYTGMTSNVRTLAVKAMLAVRADVPESVVYNILKVMFERISELREAHARARDIELARALEGMPISLHPGAIRFYQEKGISIPSELRP